MIAISKQFTRAELQDLLREAACKALADERPAWFSQVVPAIVRVDHRTTNDGGLVVELTLAGSSQRDHREPSANEQAPHPVYEQLSKIVTETQPKPRKAVSK